ADALPPAPPSWRALVAWPAPHEEALTSTPVGRWSVVVGRWALLAPARPALAGPWRRDAPADGRDG
ncbi:MAG: hypothetical protein ACO3CC_19595, partial [Alphaproteobacteria bacterium]